MKLSQYLKQTYHDRHCNDGEQCTEYIQGTRMCRIPVVQLCHGCDCCTGRRDGGQEHRHENCLAIRNPDGCVGNAEKKQYHHRYDQQTKCNGKIVARCAEDYLKYKGKITSSSDMLLKATDDYFALARILDKLIVYSHMKFDENKGVSESESLMGIVDKFADEVSEKLAFYTPEVLNADYDKIKEFIAGNESLEKYSFMCD